MAVIGNPTLAPWEAPDSALQWAIKICEGLKIDTSKAPNAVVALVCWINAENGQSGNNPLGSKLPYKNAQATSGGLMRYDTPTDGAAATAQTIHNHPEIEGPLRNNADYVKTARAIAGSNWGTSQLVVTIAIEIKGSGGTSGANWKIRAGHKVKETGHSSWRSVPFVGDTIANTENAAKNTYDAVTSGFGAIGDFLGKLTDPHTWYRAGQILLGAILLFVGVTMLFRNSSIAQAPLKAAKGIAPSGGAKAPKVGKELTPVEAPA